MNEYFWERCEKMRKERDLSADEIAKRSFMSRGAYRNALKAKSPPGAGFIDGIARALDVSAHYLITGLGDPGSYIPKEVGAVDGPRVIAEAKKIARDLEASPVAIQLVLSENPDPRMGVERLAVLFVRASEHLASAEKPTTKKAKKKTSGSAGGPPPKRQ